MQSIVQVKVKNVFFFLALIVGFSTYSVHARPVHDYSPEGPCVEWDDESDDLPGDAQEGPCPDGTTAPSEAIKLQGQADASIDVKDIKNSKDDVVAVKELDLEDKVFFSFIKRANVYRSFKKGCDMLEALNLEKVSDEQQAEVLKEFQNQCKGKGKPKVKNNPNRQLGRYPLHFH